MSNYKITEYSFNRAKELNLKIKKSQFLTKKLDVFTSDNKYIASIGDIRYLDYSHYLEINGEIYANKRRVLYHNRHTKNANIMFSKQWLCLKLLW